MVAAGLVMGLGVFFETVDVLPVLLQPGGIYFVRGLDGEVETVVAGLDGEPIRSRRPKLQMTFRSKGPLLPAGEEFGRYYPTEDLELDASASGAISDSPATGTPAITVTRGGDIVARFGPGQSIATPQIVMPAVPKRNLLIFRTPSVQDASLAGVTGTLGATRT
jgi:hypothetical protein